MIAESRFDLPVKAPYREFYGLVRRSGSLLVPYPEGLNRAEALRLFVRDTHYQSFLEAAVYDASLGYRPRIFRSRGRLYLRARDYQGTNAEYLDGDDSIGQPIGLRIQCILLALSYGMNSASADHDLVRALLKEKQRVYVVIVDKDLHYERIAKKVAAGWEISEEQAREWRDDGIRFARSIASNPLVTIVSSFEEVPPGAFCTAAPASGKSTFWSSKRPFMIPLGAFHAPYLGSLAKGFHYTHTFLIPKIVTYTVREVVGEIARACGLHVENVSGHFFNAFLADDPPIGSLVAAMLRANITYTLTPFDVAHGEEVNPSGNRELHTPSDFIIGIVAAMVMRRFLSLDTSYFEKHLSLLTHLL